MIVLTPPAISMPIAARSSPTMRMNELKNPDRKHNPSMFSSPTMSLITFINNGTAICDKTNKDATTSHHNDQDTSKTKTPKNTHAKKPPINKKHKHTPQLINI